MKTLCMDTAHKNLIVALYENDRMICGIAREAWKRQSEDLFPAIIEYMENGYECRGTTRAAAKSLKDCKPTKSRRVQELISYDGKKWQY